MSDEDEAPAPPVSYVAAENAVPLVAPPRKKKKKEEGQQQQQQKKPPPREGKATRKKRQRVEAFKAKMAKQERRKELMAALAKTMLRPGEAELYHSSAFVGRSRETNRQHARRLLLERRAGISVTPDDGRGIVEEVEVDDAAVRWEPVEETQPTPQPTQQRKMEDEPSLDEPKVHVRIGAAKKVKRGFFARAAEAKLSGPSADEGADEVRDEEWHERHAKRIAEFREHQHQKEDPEEEMVDEEEGDDEEEEDEEEEEVEEGDDEEDETEEEVEEDIEEEEEEEEYSGDGVEEEMVVLEESEEEFDPFEDEEEDEERKKPTPQAIAASFGFGGLARPEGVVVKVAGEEEDSDEDEPAEQEDDLFLEPATPPPAPEEEKEENPPTPPEVQSPAARRRKSVEFTESRLPKAGVVFVRRPPEVEEVRGQLPITMEEQTIMEAISENDVTILCGETGCGKTTQVPQFLFEAGYGSKESPVTPGMIGVTQPRRVAAVSMAHRVAYELGLAGTQQVAYQVRYDSEVSKEHTRVKFMTDGILLRELQSDFVLSQYSVIIIDEAHERNINTDILIGLLSRVVPLRNKLARENRAMTGYGKPALPLKLVIMSATLRVEDFTANKALFPIPPPVVKVQARQYPVTLHFNKRTAIGDYVGEAFSKVCKIHTMLPPGGVLIFLTGQREIVHLCKRLRSRFPMATPTEERKAYAANRVRDSAAAATDTQKQAEGEDESEEKIALPTADDGEDADADAELDLEQDDFDEAVADEDEDEGMQWPTAEERAQLPKQGAHGPLYVLPLFSALDPARQRLVFEPPPPGCRLVVVATNVAETALTIPGIAYVVDCGRVKQRRYNADTGISSFVIEWISKASADQRSGRAGRTGPGHAYRLYSSAVFNDHFPKFAEPEILTSPIESIFLQMKAMGIEKISTFPFPTPPDRASVAQAARVLFNLGAIDEKEKVTPLGRSISKFPVNPRYAKMLVLAHRNDCLPWVLTIVAALSVRDLFLQMDAEEANKTLAAGKAPVVPRKCRELWADHDSDFLASLKAVEACRHALLHGETLVSFCVKHSLNRKSLDEILKLRAQLVSIISERIPTAVAPPTPVQKQVIRQVIAGGFADQVARRLAPEELGALKGKLPPNAFAYASTVLDDPVFVHPTSFLARDAPEYAVFHEIVKAKWPYMHGITRILPGWLAALCPAMAKMSAPLALPPPRFDAASGEVKCFVRVTYGPKGWALPMQLVPHPEGIEKTRHFARALLQGLVVDGVTRFASMLSVQPEAALRSTGGKVLRLIETLHKAKVSTRDALLAKWTEDPSFLLSQFLQLIEDPANNPQIAAAWPPIH